MTIDELNVVVNARVDSALRDMKRLEKQMGSAEKSSKSLASSFLKKAAGAAAAYASISTLTSGLKYAARAASDAEETYAKFVTVFRDIEDEALGAAESLSESFGLASSTAQKLLGDTGDLLTGFGFTQQEALNLSKQVNTLAVDLASFTNYAGGASGASEALTKALLGEAESAKSLGIVINQNTDMYKDTYARIMETMNVTEQQAKAYTALELATRQSKNAIGDYARTSDSTANVSRRLNESLKGLAEQAGVAVNEGLTPLKSVLIDVVDNLTRAFRKTNDLRDAFAKWRGGALAQEDLENLQTKLKAAKDELDGMSARVKDMAAGRVMQLQELIAALEQEISMKKVALRYTQQTTTAKEEEATQTKSVTEATKEAIVAEGEKTAAVESTTQALRDYIDISEEFRTEQLEALKSSDFWEQQQAKAEKTKNVVTAGFQAMGSAFENFGEAMVDGSAGWDDLKNIATDTISSILQALGSQYAVEAAANLAAYISSAFTAVNKLGAAVKYGAASAAAYTAAGAVKAFRSGGEINEPVVGTGQRSGQTYTFGENGPENVSPSGGGGGMAGDIYIDGDRVGEVIWRKTNGKQWLISAGAVTVS